MSEKKEESKRISRRQALKYGAVVGVGVAAAAAGGAYYYSTPPKSTPTATATATTTATQLLPAEMKIAGSYGLAAQLQVWTFEGAKQAGDALGVGELTVVDNQFDPQKQLSDVRGEFARGVNAVLCEPLDDAAVPALVKAGVGANGYIHTAWSNPREYYPWDVPGKHFVSFINAPAEKQWEWMTRWFFEYLGARNHTLNVAHIQATPGMLVNTQINYGIWKALQAYPKVQVLGGHPAAYWQTGMAKEAAASIIAAHGKELNAIIAQNDAEAAGVLLAMEDAGIHVPVIGGGGAHEKTMKSIADSGDVVCSDNYFGGCQFLGGIMLVKLYDTLRGEWPFEREIDRIQMGSMVMSVQPKIGVDGAQKIWKDAIGEIPVGVELVDGREVYDAILGSKKLPWDWERMSIARSKEKGLQYDPMGGWKWGGTLPVDKIYGSLEEYEKAMDTVRTANIGW